MMRSRMLLGIVVAIVVAAAAWMLGWWSVVPVAAVVGWLQRTRGGRAGTTAIGAAAGWALLLALAMRGERFDTVAAQLESVLRLPWPALMAVTVTLAALLGWSSAALVASLTAPRSRATEKSDDPFGLTE